MARRHSARRAPALAALALLAGPPLFAQDLPTDRPATLPAGAPSKAERDRAEAAALYGLGAVQENKHRLLSAIRYYEQACKLDPDAAAPRRALVPLYIALDRGDDAVATARRVLELDPDDWETGSLYARQLRSQGQTKEAAEALRRAAGSPRLKEKPDALAQVWADLAYLQQEAGDWQSAAASLLDLANLLDHPAALVEDGVLTAQEAATRAAETYEDLGRVWLKAGDPAKAIAAFETARARDRSRAGRLALHLAEIHDKGGRPRQALACLDEYLRCRPSGTEAYEMKVRLLRQLGQANDVVPTLQAALSADGQNAALALLLARELRQVGRDGEAERIYFRLIDSNCGPDAYRGLFGLYKAQGATGARKALDLLDRAVVEANKKSEEGRPITGPVPSNSEKQAANGRAMMIALREDPELIRLFLEAAPEFLHGTRVGGRDRLHPATLRLLAALAERTRHLELAEELYRGCLAGGVSPNDEQAVYLGLLSVLHAGHKHEAVIALCDDGQKRARATYRWILFLNMSEAYQALGRFREALAAADQAVDVADSEGRLTCQRHRVQVLSHAGRHAEAIAACQALLREYNQPQKDEGDSGQDKRAALVREVRLELSQAYNAAGEYAQSDEQLRLILEAAPDDETANNNLGFQWAERGVHLDEAERLIRKAIALDRGRRQNGTNYWPDADRDNAAYVDSLGWVLFRKGDLKGARAELEKAAALPGGDDDPVVQDHLGDVLFRLGERGKAAATWRKALGMFDAGNRPKDERYQDIQQKLRQTAP